MNFDKKLEISVAGTRKTRVWKRTIFTWSAFTEQLKTPVKSTETMEEYLRMPKSKQDDLKDVGGFVGGTFQGDIRKASHVEGRCLLTLDLDSIPAGDTEKIKKRVAALSCAACIYSTRKHTAFAPRLRIIIPTDRTLAPDEYEPCARKMAELIGMEYCDPTTFDVARLMYWPSLCQGAEYIYEVFDQPFCSADGLLKRYADWRDITQWPAMGGVSTAIKRHLAKQENPMQKSGVVGAFCRTYTIPEAIDVFLPEIYQPTDLPGRYTYLGGSTVGGAVLYDSDTFLYSHHATDPCSGLLVNAFDMVRLHKYGDLDAEAKEGTPGCRLPSYMAMSRLAVADAEVSGKMAKERQEAAAKAFGTPLSEEEEDTDWLKLLSYSETGAVKKTINNALLILEHDPALKNKIAYDVFSARALVFKGLPWRDDEEVEPALWTDSDDAGYSNYMETAYGLTGKERLDQALLIVLYRHKINPVKAYLESLLWDGTPRIPTLLQDYLGAQDTPYTREVMQKALCAAAGRAAEGGLKFDSMPILVGAQGIGKSTLLRKLGKDWFSDSLANFEGKEAAELIQGVWIVEVGELTALNRQETNTIKQFLSKQEDIYRAAYAKRTEKHPRRCVFIGTSNETEFLKDSTGNRRFWPVKVGLVPPVKSVWEDLDGDLDQIWAEAYAKFVMGETLYLSPDANKLAVEAQREHMEHSEKEGIIRDFLEREIPENWDKMDLMQRRQFLNGNLHLSSETRLIRRDKVCVLEIWTELFNGDVRFLGRKDSLEIKGILRKLEGWTASKYPRRYGQFGSQRGFERLRL